MTDFFHNSLYTFGLGFGLGCVFLLMSYWNHWKTKGEFRRYKTHLSDKLELDARAMQETGKEKARLTQENESLRMQVSRLNDKPDNKLHRELEIMARAEKHMMINAPGFAPAWEMAKSQALSQKRACPSRRRSSASSSAPAQQAAELPSRKAQCLPPRTALKPPAMRPDP
jgi:hypothetical protein